MNYFEFYPGDYLRDTTRLSLVDHGAYLRLLIAYYSEETPLPADLGELYVITCAVSKADKDAVKKVAERFFPVSDEDGLRHKNRVDEEISKAQKRIAVARANGAKGGKKKEPSDNPPGTPAGNPMGSLRGTPAGTQPPTHSGEALHTPHAIQKLPTDNACEPIAPTLAGQACLLMKNAGCGGRVNPSHPDLLAALAEGVTPQTLADTAAEAIAGGKGEPFTWAIRTARNRHAAGADAVTGEPHGNHPTGRRESVAERAARFAREGDEAEARRAAAGH